MEPIIVPVSPALTPLPAPDDIRDLMITMTDLAWLLPEIRTTLGLPSPVGVTERTTRSKRDQ